jgi:hypothetical protein
MSVFRRPAMSEIVEDGRRFPEKLSLTNAKGVHHNKERAVRPSPCANWCAIRLSTGPVGLRRRQGLTAVGREGSNANCANLHRWHLSGTLDTDGFAP